ncbi:MAG TPA: hypothetical protein VFU73_11400 [Actinocrinis sp.]|nr:hypothetical protein [Actinocrinis sp.]
MVALREVLSRFRPAGVAGAPVGAAVPEDRTADRDGELACVFAALDDAEAQVRRILAGATRQAEAIRADGERQAQQILRDARERAPLERERAARRTRLETDEYCAAVLDRSSTHAESIRTLAQPRIRALVDQSVAALFEQLRLPGPGARR